MLKQLHTVYNCEGDCRCKTEREREKERETEIQRMLGCAIGSDGKYISGVRWTRNVFGPFVRRENEYAEVAWVGPGRRSGGGRSIGWEVVSVQSLKPPVIACHPPCLDDRPTRNRYANANLLTYLLTKQNRLMWTTAVVVRPMWWALDSMSWISWCLLWRKIESRIVVKV